MSTHAFTKGQRVFSFNGDELQFEASTDDGRFVVRPIRVEDDSEKEIFGPSEVMTEIYPSPETLVKLRHDMITGLDAEIRQKKLERQALLHLTPEQKKELEQHEALRFLADWFMGKTLFFVCIFHWGCELIQASRNTGASLSIDSERGTCWRVSEDDRSHKADAVFGSKEEALACIRPIMEGKIAAERDPSRLASLIQRCLGFGLMVDPAKVYAVYVFHRQQRLAAVAAAREAFTKAEQELARFDEVKP